MILTNLWLHKLLPVKCIVDEGLTPEVLMEKFPMWNIDSLIELRAQFQTFDVKQDGIIDFHEL